MKLGNPEGVVKDCEAVLKQQPDNKDFYNHLGDAQRELHRFQEAIDAYSHAISLDPKLADSYFCRGLVKEAQHDIAGALSDWASAAKFGYQPANELIKKYKSSAK